MIAAGLVTSAAILCAAGPRAISIVNEHVPHHILLAFGEAMLTGMLSFTVPRGCGRSTTRAISAGADVPPIFLFPADPHHLAADERDLGCERELLGADIVAGE